jgi:hypothetical protein
MTSPHETQTATADLTPKQVEEEEWTPPGARGSGVKKMTQMRRASGVTGQAIVQRHAARSGGGGQVAGGAPPVQKRAVQMADQREGTQIPDAATRQAIAGELSPGTTSATGAPVQWDGKTGATGAAAARTAMVAEMHTAMTAYLSSAMPGIRDTASQPRLPIADLEGAGRAAKADADRHFSSWATASALTGAQSALRSQYEIRASGPRKNLFDAQDEKERAKSGQPINPQDLAGWIAETASGCQTSITAHHFDTGVVYTPGHEGSQFWWQKIVAPWQTLNDADLRLFDLHGFALSDPESGRIVLPTSQSRGLSTKKSKSGAPSDANRGRRWSAWRTMIHEYIHQLEHPALHDWPGHNRTIGEGFCEMFTKEVLLPLLPTAAGADTARRTLVEGGDYGAPGTNLIGGPHDAGSYAAYVSRAEAIQNHLGGASIGARNAMRAIFFQGHVEFLGYDTAGQPMTAPSSSDQISVPPRVLTVPKLARITGSTVKAIKKANPGIKRPLKGRYRVPGAREHLVVSATDHGGRNRQAETLKVIAKQHGVTERALERANPGVDFGKIKTGQRIIVPVH